MLLRFLPTCGLGTSTDPPHFHADARPHSDLCKRRLAAAPPTRGEARGGRKGRPDKAPCRSTPLKSGKKNITPEHRNPGHESAHEQRRIGSWVLRNPGKGLQNEASYSQPNSKNYVKICTRIHRGGPDEHIQFCSREARRRAPAEAKKSRSRPNPDRK